MSVITVSDADLLDLRQSNGKHSKILCDMCKFYRDWHVKSDGVYGTPFSYLVDPTAVITLIVINFH